MNASEKKGPPHGANTGRPWLLWGLAAGLALVGVLALLQLVVPFRPFSQTAGGANPGPGLVWFLAGAGLIVLSLFAVWRAYLWSPPVTELVRMGKGLPLQMDLAGQSPMGRPQVQLKDYAEIQEPFAAWLVELDSPIESSGEVDGEGRQALAFFDPQSGLPIAFQLQGRLYSVGRITDTEAIVPVGGG